jgi:2-enoate reductase
MDEKYSSLFEPITINKTVIRNRFAISPMEGTSIVDWLAHCDFRKNTHDYYVARAKDGVGLMIPGMTLLRSIVGDKWLYKNPKVFEPVKSLMDEVHSYGAKIFFQLGAGWGRSFTLLPQMAKIIDSPVLSWAMKPIINMDAIMVSPDAGAPNVWMPQYSTRAITVDEIHEYVKAYAETALLCKKAGVDGVEVHAVHEGYLMDQFTTGYTNHRTDEYGGSFENRYRFAVEVVQAIKALCGEDYPVSLRYSVVSKTKGFNSGAVPGEEFVEVGRDMAESERAIKYLEEAGYDMFNCDNGTYDAWYWAHPPVYMPLNCNLEDVEHIKKFTTKPVYCAGRMQVGTAAEEIAAGKLDGVTIGRQFLAEDNFVSKVKDGRLEDVRPCISCHTACLPVATCKGSGAYGDFKSGMDSRICALNPRTFNEKKYTPVPAKKPRKIAVVGGGIGGMEAALQCAVRGHSVTLYEKTDELGGLFLAAAAPDFKEKDKELIEWYKRQLAKSTVTVKLNTEVKTLSDIAADEYIVATGGRAKKLPVEGGERAVSVEDVLRGRAETGDVVAIIGGGLSGCECAYDLALKGKHPFIVEMSDDLIRDPKVSAANSMCMRDLIKYEKIPVYLETKLIAVHDGAVVIETKGERRSIPCDTVAASVGFNAGTELVGKKLPKNVHLIGDVEEVANLRHAIWAANDLAIALSK